MSDNIVFDVKETKQPKKRVERTTREDNPEKKRVTRGTRVPLGGFSGPLDIIEENQDPSMHYVWALDDSEDGSKIERRLLAGYEFCSPEEGLIPGRTSVYQSATRGSVVRIPAGQGKYHFLMKIPVEWYEEDRARGQQRVDATEGALHNQSKQAGFYGELKVDKS